MFLQIIVASLFGSIFALVGGGLLLAKEALARKLSLTLLSFAIGSLLGAAFFELLPEAIEGSSANAVLPLALLGIFTLFIFEKFLRWYHCHDKEACETHVFSTTVLVGDAVHNFVDGIIIALSFSLGVHVGIATAIAVFLHEIPQEIGDFGILLHAGYSKAKTFALNIFTALTTPLGAIAGYFALPVASRFLPGITAFAAGLFIYIAISDLMPELKHKAKAKDFLHLIPIILGVVIIWVIGQIVPE